MLFKTKWLLLGVFFLIPSLCVATDTQMFQNFIGDASGHSQPFFLFNYEILGEIIDTLMQYAFFGMIFIPAMIEEEDKKMFEVDVK